MESVHEVAGEKVATIADLERLFNVVHEEITRFSNQGIGGLTTIPSEEMGREIQQLRQEIFQLKQASSSNPSTQKSIDSSFGNEPKISLLEKFDGTRSKFRGFLQQVKLFL